MTEFTLDQCWRYTLRPPSLARRHAMADEAHLYALPGTLDIAVPAQPYDVKQDEQDEYSADLPPRQPTGSLS